MPVIYLAKALGSRQPEIIKLFMETFPDIDKYVHREPFPLNKIYCYIYYDCSMKHIRLYIHNKPVKEIIPDCELVLYQDIVTIPLMHNALVMSKQNDQS